MNDVVAALHAGRAFADLSAWRKVHVRGADARGWLNDLLTADVASVAPGEAVRTLLLTATGRLRADVVATPVDDGVLLLQDPRQPEAVDALLARYVLSSHVSLEERPDELTLVAFPGGDVPSVGGTSAIRPSVLGTGADLLGPADRVAAIRSSASSWVEAGADDLERWRIERGVPRFPVDLTPDSLPHEVPLDEAIDFDKGCYLGQEAVAKVRNLGHPPFVILAADADGPAIPGDAVRADGETVGTVTSATALPGGRTATIVRVRWAARGRPLTVGDGSPLETRASATR